MRTSSTSRRVATALGLLVSGVLLSAHAGAESVFDRTKFPELHAQMEAHTRIYYGVSAAPFGIGLAATAKSQAAVDAIATFASGGAFAGHAFDHVAAFEGAAGVGLRGGGAAIGTAFRYLALKQEGASAESLAAARADVVAAINATHVAVAITGVTGRLARGIHRLKLDDGTLVPGVVPALIPLFDGAGDPLPEPKNNGADRADNSGGALPPGMWVWQDSCSKDQMLGWVLAMATLYDAAVDDPDIDSEVVDTLREDARAIGAMLREKHPLATFGGDKYDYDLVIMDADGRPTQHFDLNALVFDGLVLDPDSTVFNVFNALAAMGVVKALYHISGDPEAGAFLYDELIEKRCYQAMLAPDAIPCPGGWPGGALPEDGGLDYIYAGVETNFSNVNMASIALFMTLWFESDLERVAPVRAWMESRWWAPAGVPQGASYLGQPYFEAIHALITADAVGADVSDRVANLLGGFHLAPYTDAARENCDAAELASGTCIAVDGVTSLTLSPVPNRGGDAIALTPLHPKIRPPSSFDARSDPFQVNGGGAGLGLNAGGDLHAAYWMLRWLPTRASAAILRSTHARTWPTPVDPPDDLGTPPDAGSPQAETSGDEPAGADVGVSDVSALDVSSGDLDSTPPPAAEESGGGCGVSGGVSRGSAAAFMAIVASLFLMRRKQHAR